MNFSFIVLLIIFLCTFMITISSCKKETIDILNPLLYKNEICSYNGVPTVNNSVITCECYSSFADEPRKQYIKYVNDHKIQCSYQRKRRLLALILALLMPIGLDYLYLERYGYFCLIFLFNLLSFLNIIQHIILSNRYKDVLQGNVKYKHNNGSKQKNFFLKTFKIIKDKERIFRLLKLYRTINKILIIVLVIFWVIDIFLQSKGIVKDKNGIETENNLNSLFLTDED